MENVKRIIEKLKREMKKDKIRMLTKQGNGVIDGEVIAAIIRAKYIKLLLKNKKRKKEINQKIVEDFIDDLLKNID